jgi:hypothetical protein
VQNAGVDALSQLGAHDIEMPATLERFWAAVETARTQSRR